MPGTPTPILGLIVPLVGGDNNIWGTELNTNLATIDNLGAQNIVNASVNYAAVVGVNPRTLIRMTTSASNLTVTLPTPSTLNNGKSWIALKVDNGAGILTIIAANGALIGGQATWTRAMQNGFVECMSNGTTYDVVGNN
jgi:hypothetical protein